MIQPASSMPTKHKVRTKSAYFLEKVEKGCPMDLEELLSQSPKFRAVCSVFHLCRLSCVTGWYLGLLCVVFDLLSCNTDRLLYGNDRSVQPLWKYVFNIQKFILIYLIKISPFISLFVIIIWLSLVIYRYFSFTNFYICTRSICYSNL